MTQIGIMIEGQEGLSWERWRRICQDTDSLGFASLRRSDHLVSLMSSPDRDCIECWTSLALAAEWTKRIEFGLMVSPMTFRLPGVLAKIAATVDALSGGRLILGVGAGWNENEHRLFDIPFYTERERFEGLDAEQVLEKMKQQAFVGTPEEISAYVREHAKLGVDLFMLQHFVLDDSDALQLLAQEVLPAVA